MLMIAMLKTADPDQRLGEIRRIQAIPVQMSVSRPTKLRLSIAHCNPEHDLDQALACALHPF
jgi:hypothetical protein